MNIYSNSFFHRVDNWEILKLILQEGFKAFYCKEEIYRGKGVPSTYIGIPMISFCDIPLSYVAQNHYGKCGMAMSRSWGRLKHLEPVLYYPMDVSCQSTKMIIKAADSFLNINTKRDADSYRILGYAKPVIKPTKKEGYSSDNYAEREWRKVYANPTPLRWLTEEEYDKYRGDLATPKTPVGTILGFDANNIDFIMVDKGHERNLQHFIMDNLQTLGNSSNAITEDDKLTLLSRILVYENLVHNL